jgi:geranylgeranyl diphosphate synthase type II
VVTVARAAGVSGMVGGQQGDLEAERAPAGSLDTSLLAWIHTHKTGALLSAAAEVGAIHAGADLPRRQALGRYGQALGLAFQIADDILDATASREALGKTPGKDARAGKATYPLLFGLQESRRMAEAQMESALAEVADEDGVLATLTRGAVRRRG